MEILRALAVLVEPPDRPGAGRLAEALGLGALPEASAYTDLFVFQLYPYASVYVGAEGMLGGERRERVRGARRALLWEHLLSWLPVYLDKVVRVAPPFYRRWAETLRAALDAEAGELGTQAELPLHLREAPAPADPREAAPEEFLKSLLAPARSGLILVRDDLARAARELGTGVRAGERLFALRSLFGQDAAGTLGWLAREAEDWHALHLRRRAAHGRVAEWWAGRAASTAKLLRELGADAAESFRTV